MAHPSPRTASLSPELLRQFEEIIARIEAEWFAGNRPQIERFIPDAPELRPVLEAELVRIDIEFRAKAGEAASFDDYRTRFPELPSQDGLTGSRAAPIEDPGLAPPGEHVSTTSLTLLERLRRTDDHQAWSRFVDIYTPLLYRWARRSGLTDPDASDLLQDVFVLLLKKLPEFAYDPQKGSFRGWLRTLALNKLRETRRRRRETPAGSNLQLLDPVEDDASQLWDAEYRQHLVQQAMAVMQRDFEPSTWKACWETAFCGRPTAENLTR
jgi:RNA polymerase sigma-70 factor (ECF subfamily)